MNGLSSWELTGGRVVTRVLEEGCGEREDQRAKSSAPPSTPAVLGVGTSLLTSASFQSPGMQKDSSRSLPHSSRIRSSEEGEQSLQRDQ